MSLIKIKNTGLILMLLIMIHGSELALHAQVDGYRTPEQVGKWIGSLKSAHTGKVSSTVIATSPGGRPVTLIEIGNETGKAEKSNPSVFVGANFEGTRLLATEGALRLAEIILADPSNYDSLNWYIVPVGNPDAAARYFRAPFFVDPRNDQPVNDDRDEQTDEDGPNDLNGDGYITRMRQKHPDGTWIVSEKDPRVMREADPSKGERGVYKLYTEGTDEDSDGKYNEDGPGGTDVGLNFPFLFQYFTEPSGLYPGSAPESYGVMKFVFEHPDIAMIFSFGSTNFCMTPPKGGRKGEADLNRLRVPERMASRFGLSPSRTYTMEELVAHFKEAFPGENIDESAIAGFLDLGAAVNPQEGDLVFYKKYAADYADYLKEQGDVNARFTPEPARGGSFELWGYFDVGVPVFSMDLWGIPKPGPDSVQVRGGAPHPDGDQAGDEETEKELALLAFSDSLLDRTGFVEWQSYDHPTLGPVEIGGFRPGLFQTPPYAMADSLLSRQVPWILHLAGELPDLHIFDTRVTDLGSGTYQLEAWIENRSLIPFPTYMGKRNRQPAPAVLILEGEPVELISGTLRTPVRSVEGNSRVKLGWVIHTEDRAEIILNLTSRNAGSDQLTIKIGG
jgi:hypothetical protein